MQDSYQLDLVKHDTISSFVRFCINFWIGHYRLKKQQSGMTQQEIAAEKEQAYKNSTAGEIENASYATTELNCFWSSLLAIYRF
jgi:hypothetical protein